MAEGTEFAPTEPEEKLVVGSHQAEDRLEDWLGREECHESWPSPGRSTKTRTPWSGCANDSPALGKVFGPPVADLDLEDARD